MNDRKVVNFNAEDVGSVTDFILERGSGRLEYVVIKSGTILGLGGRSVAIPYDNFRWDTEKLDRLVLAATPEQLKEFPEYTPETWSAIKEPAKDEANLLQKKLAATAAGDPYAGALDTAKKSKVEGEISAVERVRSTFGDQVIITVKASDGTAKKIALGPSWYVNASPAAPMRGDKVVVDTLVLPRDPNQLLAGTELRNGSRELKLRDSSGVPAWTLKTIESDKKVYSTPFSRFLVLSHLAGKKVDCRGEECGKVNDVILDRRSGEIAFLSIDPNQNFLGISDTKRLIPWSVAAVALDATIRIDASKEMVLASPETPGEISDLNAGTQLDRVYKAFGVPVPMFEAREPATALMSGDAGVWSTRGTVISSITADSAKTVKGTVAEVSTVTFPTKVPSARAVTIRLEDRSELVVLLGPSSYIDAQKPSCEVGDSITMNAVRTTIDGRQYWIARSLECKSTTVVLIDPSNTPAWAKP
jgi:sporulation protein YlmC with PRC-barrel domain